MIGAKWKDMPRNTYRRIKRVRMVINMALDKVIINEEENKIMFKNIFPKFKVNEYCNYYDDLKDKYICSASIEIEGTFRQIINFENYIAKQLDILYLTNLEGGDEYGKK